jgi:hypothetical protein
MKCPVSLKPFSSSGNFRNYCGWNLNGEILQQQSLWMALDGSENSYWEQGMARGRCCNLPRLTTVALRQYNFARRLPLFTSRLRSGLWSNLMFGEIRFQTKLWCWCYYASMVCWSPQPIAAGLFEVMLRQQEMGKWEPQLNQFILSSPHT